MFTYNFVGFGLDSKVVFRDKVSYAYRPSNSQLEEDLKDFVMCRAALYNDENHTKYSKWDGYWRPSNIKGMRKEYGVI